MDTGNGCNGDGETGLRAPRDPGVMLAMQNPSSADLPAPPTGAEDDARRRTGGLIAALACFITWGVVPIYWKQIPGVSPSEMVAQRLLWSLVVVSLLLTRQRGWSGIRRHWSASTLGWAALSGAAIAVNWWLFLWAVSTDRVIDTSLGYFLMPLFNLVVGLLVFRERLRTWQWLSVTLAGAGVTIALVGHAGTPWLSLALCGSFGLYGALRKKSRLDSLPGLFFETLTLVPLAFAWMIWTQHTGRSVFGLHHLHASLFLMGGGLVTAFPLLWFSRAARRLPLSTVGFLQYISPSLSFLVGALLYDEPVSHTRLLAFAWVWAALILFTAEMIWHRRRHGGAGDVPVLPPELPD